MTEHVINCGCGRTMTADASRGRGAYRCGCGNRITVATTPSQDRRCWWTDCRTTAFTAAPIDLCKPHLGETVKHIASPEGYRAMWSNAVPATRERLHEEGTYVQPQPKPTWVYFLRREVLIKIGYSNSPARRAQSLNAELLATMPGGPDDERELHQRFQELWAHGEWFRPAQELIASINVLRHMDELPPITAEPSRDLTAGQGPA